MIKNLGYIIKNMVVYTLFWMMKEPLNYLSVKLPYKYGTEKTMIQRKNLNIFGLVQQIINYQLKHWKLCNGNLKLFHIQRLYEWPKNPKVSDLEIAIKCTEGRRQRDAVMVGSLLDYYSDNAMDNTGWMFTVSRAIPLLFEYHLGKRI